MLHLPIKYFRLVLITILLGSFTILTSQIYFLVTNSSLLDIFPEEQSIIGFEENNLSLLDYNFTGIGEWAITDTNSYLGEFSIQSPQIQREWVIGSHSLQVNDFITGNNAKAISRIYLHPEITLETDGVFKISSEGICKLTTSIENYKIIDSHWSPYFGKLENNLCIEFHLREGKNSIIFSWD